MREHHGLRTLPAFIIISAALLLGGQYAHAVDPPSAVDVDRATREVDRPVREEVEQRIVTPPKEEPEEIEEAPEEDKGPKFLLKKVRLVGCEGVSPSVFNPIVDRYEGREVTLEKLNILAKEIEREYLRNGLIAACFVPPQDIKEGEVTLKVVEAHMGSLDIKDSPFYDEDMIRHFWPIRRGEVLKYNEMSRTIQVLNKNPDRNVKATLHAGEDPGTTDILMDTETHFPIHGFMSFDREGSVSTGRDRTGAGIRDNNFLFVDDTLMLGTTFGKDFTGWYFYHSVPVTNMGTSIMYGYNESRSAPKKEYEPFVIRSQAQNGSFFIYQDLYTNAEYVGELSAGIDLKDKATRSTSGTLGKDRLRILSAKTTLIHRHPGSVTYITPEVSQGLNILGARRRNAFSSRNTSNTFLKFDLSIRNKAALPLGLQTSFKFKSLFSSEKLPSQEQFSLGGIDSVRGYPSQDYMADNGFQTNFELLVPSFWIPDNIRIPYSKTPLRDDITGVLFADYGYGRKRGTLSSGERTDVNFLGLGLGLRIRLMEQALIRLEWGFPAGTKPITEAENSRFHISISVEEKIFEEIQRISHESGEDRINKIAGRILDSEMRKENSPLRKTLYAYLAIARTLREQGEIDASLKYYTILRDTALSFKAQTEIYVREKFALERRLREQCAAAENLYSEGRLFESRALWEDMISSARTGQPLFLTLSSGPTTDR